jgi:hypothetical protein
MRRSRLPLLVVLATTACAASGDDDLDATGSAATDAISFTETTERAIKVQKCGPGQTEGCYTNYAITADIDGDGELDLLMANGGGHFFPTDAEPQVLMFGKGDGTFEDAITLGAGNSIVRQFAVADFDGDGRLDIYMPGGFGQHDDQLFLQKARRSFTNEIARIGANKSTAGSVHAGDIDNDGDIDIVIGDWGANPNPDDPDKDPSENKVRILENDGSGRFSEKAVLAAPGGTTTTDIDLHDVNGDFALDIILTARNGQSRLYLNDGKGAFTDVTASKAFPRKQGPFTFNAELCDVDRDGDLDVLFDGGANFLGDRDHATQILINDGTGKYTDETATRIIGEPSSDDNQVKCADVDNDGDFDLVVASLSNPMEKVLRNKDGKGHFELVDRVTPPLGDPTLAIDLGDFDHDGKVDLFTAQGEERGKPWLERIFKNGTATADENKPVFRAVEKPKAQAGKPTIFRFAVSDAHTSETGQHVKDVSVDVGGRSIPAKFVGGDIYRAEIPPQAGAFKAIPKATDRSGNAAVGAAVDIAVE